MNPNEPRLHAALDAALAHIRTTAASVAERVSDGLGTMSLSSTRIAERDLLLATQFELRRNMPSFQLAFKNALREKVETEIGARESGRRSLAATDWQSLSLVDDHEVEERMFFDRIGQMISHECDAELREMAAYMGAVLRTGRADEERNPLRADVLGAALYRAIEAVTDQSDMRKLLAREMGQAMARAMRNTYGDILRDLKARGVQPVNLSVRTLDGPGHHLPGINSAYATLPKEEFHSTRGSQSGSFDDASDAAAPVDAARPPAGLSYRAARGTSTRSDAMGASGSTRHSQYGGPAARTAPGTRPGSGHASAHGGMNPSDAQLMTLLRRLNALSSRPAELDAAGDAAYAAQVAGSADTVGRPSGSASGGHAGGASGSGLTGLMAVNLIRAHREELVQASTGKLDHMVIDVVGSLFDQILSDSRVPPQMARQIARLQLPVLRVALNDASFFSSRRHPVRRFVNRIASLACAFDDFDDGPGKHFLDRVRELVQDIVEGDFDQIELYTEKLADLESFIAQQTEVQVRQSPAAATLEGKESELRVQQRYMLQLQTALAPMALPAYLRDFLAQVWSQALVLAARRDGPTSDRYQRFKRAGRDLIMSVQPKGNPTLRKKFLMQLPPLMKDLNEGMRLIGWPEPAQKAFFAQLLPAHAESLKGAPLSELDHNMMAKQLEGIFNVAVPGTESLSAADPVPEVEAAQIEQRFTPEEMRQVGLVEQKAVDWAGSVDIELDVDPDGAETGTGDTASMDLGLDINLDMASAEPPEPSRGPQLMDHIKLGFAYQMHLKDEWQKVRLTYVSPGRSFFVFSRGRKHQETISMTSRMLARMCETGRMRAVESAYLMERATHRARKQLAALKAPTRQ